MTAAPRSQRGFALVAALWAALLLALIAAAITATIRTDSRIGHIRASAAQAAAIADAGINLAIYRLLASDPASHPPLDGTPFATVFEGHAITLRVQDETQKIDLNTAPAATLQHLLAAAGLDPDSADLETDRILDWRERGESRRLNGAKQDDYRLHGFSYGPRNGPFLSIDELRLVMGITPALYERLRPAITVVAQASAIDASAPPDLTGRAFTVRAELVEQGRSATRTATIRLSGDPGHPIWVYSWE